MLPETGFSELSKIKLGQGLKQGQVSTGLRSKLGYLPRSRCQSSMFMGRLRNLLGGFNRRLIIGAIELKSGPNENGRRA